jgi:putative mRNA 3-end processing factor
MIRQRDGIHFDLDRRIVADGSSAEGDRNIISHAHTDHLPRTSTDSAICSDITARLATARNDIEIGQTDDPSISLHPSGHIIGSTAARIEGETTYLYTGDVATRDRAYLDGFSPVPADELVIETTYGIPNYRFPDQDGLERRIMDWIQDTDDTLFLFAYALGKAQKIQYLVQQASERDIIAHGSVHRMNAIVEQSTDLSFDAVPYSENKDDIADSIVVMPSRLSRRDWVSDLVEKHDGVKAGFSGWAVDDSYRHRGGYDLAFPFSDHCDFDDLVDLVQAIDPDRVYTQHGFDEAFASYLRAEHGFDAQPLKKNQTSLNDF